MKSPINKKLQMVFFTSANIVSAQLLQLVVRIIKNLIITQ